LSKFKLKAVEYVSFMLINSYFCVLILTNYFTTMNLKTLLLFVACLFLGIALQAQNTAEKEFIETWMQQHPTTKYIVQSQFAASSAKEQAQYKAAGYLICAGDELKKSDITAFEQAYGGRVMTGDEAKAEFFAKNPDKLRSNTGSTYQAPAPLTFRVTRAELATIPAEKQAYMLAHPDVYIIVD
jgi:hypothetical protein